MKVDKEAQLFIGHCDCRHWILQRTLRYQMKIIPGRGLKGESQTISKVNLTQWWRQSRISIADCPARLVHFETKISHQKSRDACQQADWLNPRRRQRRHNGSLSTHRTHLAASEEDIHIAPFKRNSKQSNASLQVKKTPDEAFVRLSHQKLR